MKTRMVTDFVTGSRRGYIHAAERGKESQMYTLPKSSERLRGNAKKLVEKFLDAGCTHYTIKKYQGTERGYSNNYYYLVYTGYIKED